MISPNGAHPQNVPAPRVRVIFGPGTLHHLGQPAKADGAPRVVPVSDAGPRAAGHVERAVRSLYRVHPPVRVFDDVGQNPTTIHVGKGVIATKGFTPDRIVGLGGGSAMDCAK